jgi:hypothetical protein
MQRVSLASATWTTEFIGIELDWLGCDDDGLVGCFSSAGRIAVPAIAASLFGEAVLADAIGPTDDHTTSEWVMLAELGLFAFDCNRGDLGYDLIAQPMRPVHLDQLPPAVARFVVVYRLPSLYNLKHLPMASSLRRSGLDHR